MRKRKRIGLFVSYPEMVHVRRIMDGIMTQCKKYDYDLCVFAPSTHLSFPHANYVKGEENIFELANFDELDGVIIDYSTMTGDTENYTLHKLMKRLEQYPELPKCSLEIPIEGTKLIETDNSEVFREMARHVIEVHGKKKLCILTGPKDNPVAEERLRIFLDEIHKHGLTVPPEYIIYGDFWYYCGDALARRFMSGELETPEAILCASDSMAIGVMDRLRKSDIRIPEDVVIIGYDATDEGAVNQIPLSSYDPSETQMGADAVDYVRSCIEPDAALDPLQRDVKNNFHPGGSCGCQTDPTYAMKNFRNMLYLSSYNHADEDEGRDVGIGTLMESYALEGFTASKTAAECIKNIFDYSDLLNPFYNFYLCLKQNWLDMDDNVTVGYPDKMSVYVAASTVGGPSYFGEEEAVTFQTTRMLPYLKEEREKASVFYFSPVHFDGTLLGYAVLNRDLCEHPRLNVVYRNWLRYINNALEMTRSKERLQTLSVRDEMTGAYNRRGMYELYRAMLADAQEGDALFVSVVDMDGLKYVNDTFGHSEGDLGIKTVCTVLTSVARENEICVRSGGDEFFLIGIGKYGREDEAGRASEFSEAIAKRSDMLAKPYKVSASIGCAVFDDCKKVSLDNALSEADERMYRYKVRNRRHRSV